MTSVLATIPGGIPTHWKDRRIRSLVAHVASGPSPTCENRNIEGDAEWGVLKTTAITWSGWNPSAHKVLPSEFWGKRSIEVRKGDVIVTKAGPRHRVGVVAYVDRVQPRLVVSGKMVLLRPDPRQIHPQFMAWMLSTPGPQGFLNAHKTGMAESQMNFSNEALLGLVIPLPPLHEQRQIVDYLDPEIARIDSLIRVQKEVLLRLYERDLAVLDSRIEQLAVQFGSVPFRRFIVGMEQGVSPQCDNMAAEESEWGVLKVSSVKGGAFLPLENKRLPEGLSPDIRYEVRENDLLVTRANTPALVGAVAVVGPVRRKLMLCDKIFRIRTTSDLDKNYLAMVARGTRIRDLCAAASHGSSQSMANLKTEEVKDWPVPPAPLSEQRQALAEVSAHHSRSSMLRTAVERQLGLLTERRQALIAAAVTGQIDVATARGVKV
ncbi:restriction endonuclease subunit S [Micromonospora sp. H33]|uniref:restriction endonuclease subunit S n=1 Tax=Micromonospora sp. H33 TaxID=3452215 RepID=UPI003F8BE2AF